MSSEEKDIEFKKECEKTIKEFKHLKQQEKELKKTIDDCDLANYKYGREKLSLMELLEIIIKEKKGHVKELLELFPLQQLTNVNVTRSHVFEALWIIIFRLRLDDIAKKNSHRVFYKSIEQEINPEQCNSEGINKFFKDNSNKVRDGNASGIADIYFVDTFDKPNMNQGYPCENKCESKFTNTKIYKKEAKQKKEEPKEEEKEKEKYKVAYLYSSKYFKDITKKGIGSFDIEKIYTEAFEKMVQRGDKFKIGVVTNDKQVVFEKCVPTQKRAAKILDKDHSYDLGDLNIYYNRLIEYLKNIDFKSENPFLDKKDGAHELALTPKFHQKLFIDFTIKRIEQNKDFKFVWGAVPRSGKSYMIGGLIAKYKPKNVLIILGAVSETHEQFRKMFNEYKKSFGDYEVIDISEKKISKEKFDDIKEDKPNIVIVSQQQLWQTDKTIKKMKNTKSITKYPKLDKMLESKSKMIFFDEIHQGASANADAQQEILEHYIVKKDEELTFPFIMVTATFLKPLIKYKKLGNKEPIILQWTYDMMQNMKTIEQVSTQKYMIDELESERNEEVGKEKSALFKKLLDDYQKSGYSLYDLQEEYLKEPSLTIISPEMGELSKPPKDTISLNTNKNSNNLTLNFYENGDVNVRDIFNIKKLNNGSTQGIKALLDYIINNVYLNPKGALAESGFNVIQRQHSQLWFLPTNLNNRTKGQNDKEEGEVEPMMRYLLIEMMKTSFFKDNFCVVLVHSKKTNKLIDKYKVNPLDKINEPYKTTIFDSLDESKNSLCFSTVCLGEKNDKECLRQQECMAYSQGKSLIILTGAKLRLGISLPCVDIALHMDPINSSDTIYQSMFRVLTPSPNKKTGFFVDLLKNRLIKFLYEYENNLNFNKKEIRAEDKLKRMRDLIYSHNLNGIKLDDSTNEYVTAYNNLLQQLGLENVDTFMEKSIEYKINEQTAKDVVDSVFSDDQINVFFKNIGKQYIKNLQQKIESNLMKRGPGHKPIQTQGETNSKKDKNKKDKEISMKEKREHITIYLLNLLALFILFYDEDFDNCSEKDVDNGIKKILDTNEHHLMSYNDWNNICQNEELVIDCYFKNYLESSIKIDLKKNKDETKEQYEQKIQEVTKTLVDALNSQINTFKTLVKEIERSKKPELINIYCNIKSSFMAIKNEYHVTNLKNDACSENFIKDEKILKIIRERLTVREDEKKEHGEVFTPPDLVCEMLNTLPSSVWSNKDFKWLDPANGIGNYPVIVYYKLMEGLKKGIPDDKKRSKHIIEKMLFMVELNPVNVRVCKKIFKMIDKDATPNIIQANFLENKWENKWGNNHKGLSKFHIIMGNPPYNKDGTGKGGGVFWKEFAFKGLDLLNKDGFLLYIHPTGWRKPVGERASAGDVWNIFKKYCLYFVKMSDIKIPNFPNVDYYVLQKSEKKCKTYIVSEFNGMKSDVQLNISELPFIPHFLNEYVLSIIKKIFSKPGERFGIVYNQSFKPTKEDETKSGVPHTYYYVPETKDYKLVFKKYEDGKKPEYIDKPKIIMTSKAGKKKAHLYPVYFSKEMGSARNTMYQEISPSDNKENILLFLNSILIHFLLKITQYSEAPNYINEFKILNMIGKPNTGSLKTDEDIYKYYGITKEEQQFIEEVVGDKPKSKNVKKSKNENQLKEDKSTKTKKKKKKKLIIMSNNDSPTSGPKAGTVETKKTKKRIISKKTKKTKTKKAKTKKAKTKKAKKTKKKQSATQRKKTKKAKKTKKKKYMLIKGLF